MMQVAAKHRFLACVLAGGALVFVARHANSADATDGRVRLLGRTIDTSAAVARNRAGGQNAGKIAAARAGQTPQALSARGTRPYLVQFAGHILPAWKLAVEKAGGTIRGYVPDDTLIVEAAPDRLAALTAIAAVQWLGEYEPGDKLAPRLLAHLHTAAATNELVSITIVAFSADDLERVQASVTTLGGRVDRAAKGALRGLVRASMPPAKVPALAAMGEVEWIEPFLPHVLYNNVAVLPALMNVTPVWTNFSINGTSQLVAVADTGLDSGNLTTLHPDFTNRVQATYDLGRPGDWSDTHGHGTHVCGSVLGNGSASDGLYRGVAWGARLIMQSLLDSGGGLGGIPADLNDLFRPAYTNGARVHSNSWGASEFGVYNTDCYNADQFIWDHPDMLVLFAAGNDGRDVQHNGVVSYNRIGTPGTAKNVLTVGAAENQRGYGTGGYSSYTWNVGSWNIDYPTAPISIDYISTWADGVHQGMAAFSSRGPCNDGRIKPEIVAPGTDIVSCRSRAASDTGWGLAGNTNYMFDGGTSMATPLMAGAAVLARQFLVERRGMTNPSAALLKATLLNGARSLTPGQYGTGAAREIPAGPRPNPVEGWGHVNIAATLFPAAGLTNGFRDGDTLATGQTNSYSIASTGSNRVSITLAWSDYPAELAAATKLVNDLDLYVITPDGTTNFASGRASPDRVNNVEGLDLDPAPSGTVTVRVVGCNVPSGPQPYALAWSSSTTSSFAKAGSPLPGSNETGVARTALLSWGNGGGATGYRVYFGTNAAPGDGEFQSAQTATFFAPGPLAYCTTYFWRVDATNAAGTVLTGDVWSFQTEGAVVFSEGFENGGAIPSGWTQTYTAGATDWIFMSGSFFDSFYQDGEKPPTPHSGNYNACMYQEGYSDQRTKLISPAIDFGIYSNNASLSFWHYMENWGGDQDYLNLYYRTNASASWVLLQSYTTGIAPWTRRTVALPNPGSTYFIAFEGDAYYGYGVCIDDVQVTGADAPKTLTIVSPQGGAAPAGAAGPYPVGWPLACAVTNSPLAGGVGTQYVCVGATVASNAVTQAGATNLTLILTNNATLTWNWQTQVWLAVATTGNGAVAPSNGWQAGGSNLLLTATPAGYWSFGAWGGDTGGCSFAANTMTAAMTRARSLSAAFAAILATNQTPQWWLAQYGLTNGGAGFDTAALADQDGDGMPAWQEYVADTDPTNRASVLRILGCGPGAVTFTPASTGRSYAIMSVTNLPDTNWLPIAVFQPGTGAVMTLTDTNTLPRRFDRIGVRLP